MPRKISLLHTKAFEYGLMKQQELSKINQDCGGNNRHGFDQRDYLSRSQRRIYLKLFFKNLRI
eukprot:snap_masked-scaffold_8-processed-gene-8.32-mRNA-1 protein AED:1.00 eAED:1.00 QI:0/-1/0/0/-1/1/1/0/62